MTTARKRDLIMILAGLFVIVLDQLTKSWVVQFFVVPNSRDPIPLLGPFLELAYVRNSGVAFSLLSSDSIKFLFIALAIAVIGYLYWRNRENGSLLLKFSFGLVVGGALGNLIDRFRLGYVIDFIHFHIPNVFEFAVFNIADSAISIGVVLLAFLLWQGSAGEAKEQGKAVPSVVATDPPSSSSPSVPRVRRRITGE
ncbi:MAG TPA: signal peptidase II [Ktedonobacterales bacterium]|jgi:signal peptidase II|nr:signal peptidase II [Ktedonobacterales bacterium]